MKTCPICPICPICRQPMTPRHGHPHDFVGPDLSGKCLACNKEHTL